MISKRWEQEFKKAIGFQESGDWAKAEKAYLKLCELAPYHFDVLHLCGTASLRLGHLAVAIEKLTRALSLNPASVLCATRLGIAYNNSGHLTQSEAVLKRALERDRHYLPARVELGKVLWKLGKLDEAQATLTEATMLKDASAEAHETLGALITVRQGYGPSEAHFREATRLDPARARSWFYLGVCRYYLGYIGEALTHLAHSITLDGKFAQAHAAFGLALEKCFRLNHAFEAYSYAIELQPTSTEVRSSMLLLMHYLGRPKSELDKAHQDYGALFEGKENLQAHAAHSRDPHKRIKLAFISPDFRTHAVAQFIEPLIQYLDKTHFELFLYHDLVIVDETTDRLKAHAQHYYNLTGLQSNFVAQKIKTDGIDVLVDLAGHTGYNRLPLFAQKVAPVQITYLGYPDTTGLTAMDYRFVDPITDPETDTSNYYSEKRIRFSACGWSYMPPVVAGEVDAPSEGPITFGCINNYAKVTDFMVGLWAILLQAMPEARLVIKGEHFNDPLIRGRLMERLIAAKIPGGRVELWDKTNSLGDYFKSFARLDVALDTFPYNGTTTTCDTLWMGVPVITLSADSHVNRVGESLLSAVGHSEWVARSPEEYVRRAVLVAKERPRTREKRKELREAMRASLLCKYEIQAQHFGNAVKQVWQTWCKNETKPS